MTAPDLRQIVEVAPLLRAGAVSPLDLVRSCLAQMDARHDLNAFITRMDDEALADARQCEKEIAAGEYRGPLHGIPIAVKDLIDVRGTRTTSGSALPVDVAERDAPSIAQLRAAGAIIIGKTNLHEFAFGTTSDETAFGPVRHPLDRSRSAGGSSGGSAAALATGMCFAALGTDTGGSIRIPSAACGTVGVKPTLGEISTAGVIALSTTLDHLGPMTRSVADAALMFDVLKGRAALGTSAAAGPLTFGVPRGYLCDVLERGVRDTFEAARAALTSAGHTVRDVEIAHAQWTPDVYLHIVLPEAARYHAAWLERHAAAYSPGVRLRLEMGRYILAEDYIRALDLRDVLRPAVDHALDGCHALLLPSLAIPAPPIGAAAVDVDGTSAPVRAVMLRLTQLFNITGHPAVAIPGATGGDSLPRGLQIVGRHHETERLLEIAAAVEPIIAGREVGA
ncbi:MAG TPA: amidase [Vicinamibacterales bacterium]|nr:amidase [Vicinamibacterales bacterium]